MFSSDEIPEDAMVFRLPIPPSSNNRMFWKNGRMVLSSKYRSWKNEAVRYITNEFESMGVPFLDPEARYRCGIFIAFPDKRRRDIDGLAKPVLDAITESNTAWEDDSQVDEVLIVRVCSGKDCKESGTIAVGIAQYPKETE